MLFLKTESGILLLLDEFLTYDQNFFVTALGLI